MKFLCDNCKAKYQIPDEKIAGRTLRMKCRKCGHNIIIRGPKGGGDAGAERRPVAASRSRRTSGSQAGPARRTGSARRSQAPAARGARKSALGAEFRRGGSLAPAAPPAARPATEWHVAINDVPVGPIKREEVARKIGTGAVTGDSLVWREGFDDWRPLREAPELAGLLQQRRVPAPPRTSSPGGRPERSNVVPIGGRLGAAAAPSLDDFEDEQTVMAPAPAFEPPKPKAVPAPTPAAVRAPAPAAQEQRVPSVAPAAAAAAVSDPFAMPAPVDSGAMAASSATTTGQRQIPVGAWIAMVGAGAFGIALAVIVAPKLLDDDEPQVAVAEDEDPLLDEPAMEFEMPDELEEPTPEAVPDEAVPEEEHAASMTSTMRSTNSSAMMTAAAAPTTMSNNSMLTAAQQELLARFGMDTGSGVSTPNLNLNMGSSSSGGGRPLDPAAVRRVVSARSNQQSLQRCYERAIRGMGDPPSVRINVGITVGASGSVTNVDANPSSADFGGLTSCIERTVRRWRFPPSSSGGRTQFPLVFSGQ